MSQDLPPHPSVKKLAKTVQGFAASGGPAAELAALGDFGTAAGTERLTCFSGYLGGKVADGARQWQVLFIDVTFREWLLLDDADIVHSEEVTDSKAPGGKRNLVWIKSDGDVGRGNDMTTPAALFLSGAFTRAGDFSTSLRGDTYSPSSGLICEAITPGGCGSNSFRP